MYAIGLEISKEMSVEADIRYSVFKTLNLRTGRLWRTK